MASLDERFREIIKVAISNEENAEKFYREAAEKVKLEHAKTALLELAKEETGHAEFLKKILEQGVEEVLAARQTEKIQDFKIVDYLSVKELNEYSNYQDVLTAAMQREKIAYEFYQGMADLVSDDKLRGILLKLAEVEMGHKNRLERLYEEEFYQEF
ncbi:MAG: ferritin family protein [Acidobacteria bacterium]|nr:ferritin family protein [Acidobacteriota bacterium]